MYQTSQGLSKTYDVGTLPTNYCEVVTHYEDDAFYKDTRWVAINKNISTIFNPLSITIPSQSSSSRRDLVVLISVTATGFAIQISGLGANPTVGSTASRDYSASDPSITVSYRLTISKQTGTFKETKLLPLIDTGERLIYLLITYDNTSMLPVSARVASGITNPIADVESYDQKDFLTSPFMATADLYFQLEQAISDASKALTEASQATTTAQDALNRANTILEEANRIWVSR